MSQGPNDPNGIQADSPRKLEMGFTANKPSEPSAMAASPLRQALRWWPAWAVLVLLVSCAGLSFSVYTCYHPTDSVSVTVTGLADKGKFVCCVVVDSSGRARVMKRYFAGIPYIAPGAVDPDQIGDAIYVDGKAQDHVVWASGDRYGVVTQADGEWHITWFNAEEAPVTGVMSGRSVLFDLRKGQTQHLPADEAEGMGLKRRARRE
jgi:hypothetical protein